MDVTPKRFAVNVLHGDERLAVLLADVIDGANTRVIQSGCGSRFAPKAFERQRFLRQFFGEKFEGYVTFKPAVVGLEHDSHSAGSKLFQNAIVRNGLTNHGEAKSRASRNSGYNVGSSGPDSGTDFLLSVFGGFGAPSRLKTLEPSPKLFAAACRSCSRVTFLLQTEQRRAA